MAEPHIRRFSLFDYAALAVGKIIHFGGSDTMPALIQIADLPRLLVFAIRDIKTNDEAADYLKTSAAKVAVDNLQKKVISLVSGGTLPVYDPEIFLRVELSAITTDKDLYLVRLDDVSAWLQTQGVEVDYCIKFATDHDCEEAKTEHTDIAQSGDHLRWPWGNHHTELLGHLEAAALEFWVKYDPKNPRCTAPKNETVIAWLIERQVPGQQRRVSDQMAKAIATMLRPDGLPTGPRKVVRPPQSQ